MGGFRRGEPCQRFTFGTAVRRPISRARNKLIKNVGQELRMLIGQRTGVARRYRTVLILKINSGKFLFGPHRASAGGDRDSGIRKTLPKRARCSRGFPRRLPSRAGSGEGRGGSPHDLATALLDDANADPGARAPALVNEDGREHQP